MEDAAPGLGAVGFFVLALLGFGCDDDDDDDADAAVDAVGVDDVYDPRLALLSLVFETEGGGETDGFPAAAHQSPGERGAHLHLPPLQPFIITAPSMARPVRSNLYRILTSPVLSPRAASPDISLTSPPFSSHFRLAKMPAFFQNDDLRPIISSTPINIPPFVIAIPSPFTFLTFSFPLIVAPSCPLAFFRSFRYSLTPRSRMQRRIVRRMMGWRGRSSGCWFSEVLEEFGCLGVVAQPV